MKRLIGTIVFAASLSLATATTALANGGNSAAAGACQKGGYLALVGEGGETFKNTGDCVSFAARGGKFATGIIVPAGHTVTFNDPTLSACNALVYGYSVGGSTVPLGGKAYGCFTVTDPDVTVGPFPTAVVLRVYLDDQTCGATYFSDGNHAHVTQLTATSYLVDIADAGGFCERENDPAEFTGPGNLRVEVVIN
ncbi:MAG TPA: hypothetical protein VEO91_11355 [Candidatus Limnocylindria bacterium]|nr:hypothetical protein [Candidatus Limnocylindria bacterium]